MREREKEIDEWQNKTRKMKKKKIKMKRHVNKLSVQ